jgi:hypothetical protein
MAARVPSSKPLFNETGWDLNPALVMDYGANQWLGDQASHHDAQPNITAASNKVQPGALDLITTTVPASAPSKGKPLGGR